MGAQGALILNFESQGQVPYADGSQATARTLGWKTTSGGHTVQPLLPGGGSLPFLDRHATKQGKV